MKEIRHRKELLHFGKLLHENGYVDATDGNLSVRLDGQSLLVTRTSVSKGTMRLQDLIVVDMEGRNLAGRGRVTSEIAMHLQIYRTRSDVNAVVHAHRTGTFAKCTRSRTAFSELPDMESMGAWHL